MCKRPEVTLPKPRSLVPLAGKTAIVTGSARGLGVSMALELANMGADVVIIYKTVKSNGLAAKVAAQVRSFPHHPQTLLVRADLATLQGPQTIIESLKAWRAPADPVIDILVNNAAIAPPQPLISATAEHFSLMLNLNVRGPALLTAACTPYMPPRSRIISISSLASRQVFTGLGAYGASKAALEAMTRYWASELGPRGTTANCVLVGAVWSDLLIETNEKIPGIMDSIARATPLENRVGTPEEVAQVIGWLASPESGWVTGQVISASGGNAMF